MIPRVMTSHPTVDWERRADSFWAVTRLLMHSSDIRSKIMERWVDFLGVRGECWRESIWVDDRDRKEVFPMGVG